MAPAPRPSSCKARARALFAVLLAAILVVPGCGSGEVWAALGGFTSPNRGVDLSVYPGDVARRAARALVEADVVFDLSDLQPPAFGSTPGQGLGKLLQDFVADPGAIDRLTAEMEAAANALPGLVGEGPLGFEP